MTTIQPFVDQVQTYLTQYAPGDVGGKIVPAAIMVLIGGIGLSVLGAKLARPALTAALALLGVGAGISYAQQIGWPVPLIALIGAAIFGTVAFLTFRMWVGVLFGIVAGAVALGAFGYKEVAPHAAEFDTTMAAVVAPGQFAADMNVPVTPDELRTIPPREWAQQFWGFVQSRDANIENEARLVGLGAGAIGLFLGVIAVRWMLILATSLLGTSFMAAGVATLLAQFSPQTFSSLEQNPAVTGMAVGGFLVTSLILQTILTHRSRSESKEEMV